MLCFVFLWACYQVVYTAGLSIGRYQEHSRYGLGTVDTSCLVMVDTFWHLALLYTLCLVLFLGLDA